MTIDCGQASVQSRGGTEQGGGMMGDSEALLDELSAQMKGERGRIDPAAAVHSANTGYERRAPDCTGSVSRGAR
jgi:hypothetical protein